MGSILPPVNDHIGVIVVVASSEHRGNLAAFLSTLPDWLPVPVVIAVSGPPLEAVFFERLRDDVLVPIVHLDRPRHLEPGMCYLARADQAPMIRASCSYPSAPSVDEHTGIECFLRSATLTFAERALAVVLEGGMEHVGPSARKLVLAGGRVLAQGDGSHFLARTGVIRSYASVSILCEAIGIVAARRISLLAV